MKYKINEIFYSIQGEAEFAGTPSIFIRLQGCEVGCSWCDTKHTWEADAEHNVNIDSMLEKQGDSYKWAEMEVPEIIKVVNKLGNDACHVVITGGEPLEQNIDNLVSELVGFGHTVQVETSGTQPVSEVVSTNAWVTVSPKINMKGGKEVLVQAFKKADEIKMPVGKESDIENLKKILGKINIGRDPRVWLQPISQNKKATYLCIETAKKTNWRLSIQAHKFLNVR